MKVKSIKLMILTAIVTASFTTNVVYASKPSINEKNTNKIENKQKNGEEKENKKASKEIYTLTKRLDQIENSYKKVNVKLEEYFNGSNTSEIITDTPTDTTTGSETTTDTQTDTTTDSTTTTDIPADTTTGSTITTDTPTDTTAGSETITDTPTDTAAGSETTTDTPTDTAAGSTTTTDTPTDTTTGSTETTDTPANTTTGSETTTDTSTDITTDAEMESEYENEDSQVSNSFYGKLNAIMNRLDTAKRQLNRISSLDSEAISNLNTRTDELINQVKASMEKVSKLQSESVTNLKNKSNKRTMEDQKVDEQKKSWKIHFTKALDPKTINLENIMIIDSKNNIVDVDVSYNKDSNDVVIEAKDGFIKSETYSILISSDVKSLDGKSLPKSIEKKFTVQ